MDIKSFIKNNWVELLSGAGALGAVGFGVGHKIHTIKKDKARTEMANLSHELEQETDELVDVDSEESTTETEDLGELKDLGDIAED